MLPVFYPPARTSWQRIIAPLLKKCKYFFKKKDLPRKAGPKHLQGRMSAATAGPQAAASTHKKGRTVYAHARPGFILITMSPTRTYLHIHQFYEILNFFLILI